ncbi:MAG: septum formation initiator family protein [Propionibacteriaceae bacterium]|nr:septum formation initiator family protein [Propionibacteriaceae bacterium]
MRENRLNRQPSGPGRSTKRAKVSASASSPSPKAALTPGVPSTRRPFGMPGTPRTRTRSRSRGRRAFGFTRRALVLFAVVAVLALSFASSLRVWLVQNQELAAANADIEQRTARIAELEGELVRWEDPAYVTAQARERLGWVVPGEVGYRVLGADGEVLSGSSDIEGVGAPQASQLAPRWWDKLAVSVERADERPVEG